MPVDEEEREFFGSALRIRYYIDISFGRKKQYGGYQKY